MSCGLTDFRAYVNLVPKSSKSLKDFGMSLSTDPSRPLKIFVSGDVNGKFDSLFKRIASIQSKSADKFEMLLCVGNFFGSDLSQWKPYKNGSKSAPITTYVLGANEESHALFFSDDDGCELAENVLYLGRQGLFKSSSGLSIAYISGLDGGEKSDFTHFSQEEVHKLSTKISSTSGFSGVDILLTSVWPRGVSTYGVIVKTAPTHDSPSAADLAVRLRPRYHFAGTENIYYERNPYRNHQVLSGQSAHVTRFIALAHVGNKAEKFLYAFNITPLKYVNKSELYKQPDDTTEIPYKHKLSEIAAVGESAPQRNEFFYGAGRNSNQHDKRGSDGKGGPPSKRTPAKPCWFCLASPEVEKHLIVSIGEHSYVTLARGALNADHVLIMPVGHTQSQVTCEPEETKEIEKYKEALTKFYKTLNLLPVFFERNFRSFHCQVQAVGIPRSAAADVKSVFVEMAERANVHLGEIPQRSDLKQIVQTGVPYFYVELPDNEKLFCRIQIPKQNQQRGERQEVFPLQLGREILADERILNIPNGGDWKAMTKSKPQETKSTEEFRRKFSKFDFNAL